MEFHAPSVLGKRPRGFVPDDVAARRGGGAGGGSDEDEDSGDELRPTSATERAVKAALKVEAAQKAAQKGESAAAKKAGKSVSFAEPEEEACEGIKQARATPHQGCFACRATAHTNARQ